MIILPYGDSALLVNFDQRIDPIVNDQVIALNEAVKELPGVTFTIPAYSSLTVGFDSKQLTFQDLRDNISSLHTADQEGAVKATTYHIPVCYEPPYAQDMTGVMEFTGLTAETIIAKHTEAAYRVFMVGFVAGFAYLGTLPKALYCPRKSNPRKLVEEGSVGLAGYQTGIYPTDAPGGWQLIGKTPVPTFRPAQTQPALLQPGDFVRFKSVSAEEFLLIEDSVKAGSYEVEVSHA
jgi:inhibitor of KinA